MFSTNRSAKRTNSFGKACDLGKERRGTLNFSKNAKVAEIPKTPPPLPNRSPTTRLTFADDLDSAYYSSSSSGGDSVVSSALEEPPPDYEVTYEELDAIRHDIYKRQQPLQAQSRNYPPPPGPLSAQPMRITQVQGGGLPPTQPSVSKSNGTKRPGEAGHHYFSIRDTALPPIPSEQMSVGTAATSQQASQPHVHVHLCQGECKSTGVHAGQGHFHPNLYNNNNATRGLPPSGWQNNDIPPPPSVTSMYGGVPEPLTSPGAYQEIPAQKMGYFPHATTSGRSNSLGDVMIPAAIAPNSASVKIQGQNTPYYPGPQVVNIENIPDMLQLGTRAGSPLPPPPNFPAPPPPIFQGQTTQKNALNGPNGSNRSLKESPSPPLPPPPPELLDYNSGLEIYEDIPGQRAATEQPNIPQPPPAPPIPAPPPPPPLPTSTPQRKYSTTRTNTSEPPKEESNKPQQQKPRQDGLSFSAAEIGNALKTLKKTKSSTTQKKAPNVESSIPDPVSVTPKSPITPPATTPPPVASFSLNKSPQLEREKRPVRSSSATRVQNKFGSSSDDAKEQIPKTQQLRRTNTTTKSGVNGSKAPSTVEDLSPARLRPTRSIQPETKATVSEAPSSSSVRSDVFTSLRHANTAPGELSSGYSSSMSECSDSSLMEEHTVSPSAIAAKQGRGRSFVVRGKEESSNAGNSLTSAKSSQGGITQHNVPTVNAPVSPKPFGASRLSQDKNSESSNPAYASIIKPVTTAMPADKPEDEDDSEKRKLSPAEIMVAQKNFSQRDGKYQSSYTGTNQAAALTSRITAGLTRVPPEEDKNVSAQPKGPTVMPKMGGKVPLPNSPLLSALYLTSVIKSKQTVNETNTTTTTTSSAAQIRKPQPSVTSASNQKGDIHLSPKNMIDFERLMASNQDKPQTKMEGIDVTKIPGYVQIPANTPAWKKQVMEKKNAEVLKKYQAQYEDIIREQRAAEERKRQEAEERKLEEEKWKGIPEWKRKIMRDKKAQPPGAAAQPPPAAAPAQQKPPTTAPKQKQAQPPPKAQPPPQPAQPAEKKLDVRKAQPLPPEKPAPTPADIPLKISTASITFKQNPAGTGAQEAIPIKRSIKVLKRSKA